MKPISQLRICHLRSLLVLSVSASALANPVLAQDSDNGERRLDSIVVTAQKKEENLQDVPASISAFSEEALDAKRIVSLNNIAEFTPGLFANPNAADANGLRLFIRGIGTFDPQFGLDARVAVYTDGIYLGRTQGLAFDSPDLERVEVLKGPQGTLYGRNTVAGAINLISARPNSDEFSGKASVDYGSYQTVRTRAALNIPVADNVGLRVSGIYSGQDGWVENNGLGEDFGGHRRWGGRAALGIDLTDSLTVDFAADYLNSTNQTFFYQAVPDGVNPAALFLPAVNTVDGRQEEVATTFRNGDSSLESWGAVMTTSFDWSENDNLKLVAGWRRAESDRFVTLLPDSDPAILTEVLNAVDLDNDPTTGLNTINGTAGAVFPFFVDLAGETLRPDYGDQIPRASVDSIFASLPEGQPTLEGHEQFSVELTATGSVFDSAVDYTLGLFYFNEDSANARSPLPTNERDAQDFLNFLAVFPLLTGPPADFALAFDSLRNSTAAQIAIDTSAFAAYGQLTWHVTDRLRLTGGMRFSTEERDGLQQATVPFFGDTTTLLGNIVDPNITTNEFDSVDPAVVVEYDLSDTLLVYASRKESFRAGGFNSEAIAPRLMGQTFGSDFVFDPEEITAYEAGFKGDFLDGRLRFNAAGFYYDFDNEQATLLTNEIVTTERIVVNTDSELWGGEFDTVLLIGERFTLTGNYNYTDGSLGDQTNPVTGEVRTRDRVPGAPKNSYAISLDFADRLTDRVDFFSTATFSHSDSTEVSPGVLITDRNLLSLRLGLNYEMDSGNVASLSFWAENLTDDEYTIDAIDFSPFAAPVVVFGQPRTWGVTVGVNF